MPANTAAPLTGRIYGSLGHRTWQVNFEQSPHIECEQRDHCDHESEERRLLKLDAPPGRQAGAFKRHSDRAEKQETSNDTGGGCQETSPHTGRSFATVADDR